MRKEMRRKVEKRKEMRKEMRERDEEGSMRDLLCVFAAMDCSNAFSMEKLFFMRFCSGKTLTNLQRIIHLTVNDKKKLENWMNFRDKGNKWKI